jgi:protein-S-isoprenylcysteine O-methyltransferase Ste14
MWKFAATLFSAGGFIFTLLIWRTVQEAGLPLRYSWILVVGAVLLVFPVVWFATRLLGKNPSEDRLLWTTGILHLVLMVLFGVSVIEAVRLFQLDAGPSIPVPPVVGLALMAINGFLALLSVANLAISGLGAPFAIALSRRLAVGWMYRWTRNPMVLFTLATLLSAALYLQSLWFALWVLLLATPAWIYFLKTYEEKELGWRFGESYRKYRASTPFLLPKKPHHSEVDGIASR